MSHPAFGFPVGHGNFRSFLRAAGGRFEVVIVPVLPRLKLGGDSMRRGTEFCCISQLSVAARVK